MKIIHLSDTHVGRDNNAQRLQALLDDIASLGAPTDSLIIHTGDLNDTGSLDAMQQSRALLDPMVAKGWRMLLCPGNHDCGDARHVDPHCAQAFSDHFSSYLFGTQPKQYPVLTLTPDCALIGLDSNAAEMSWWQRWAAEGFLGAAQIRALNTLLDRPDVRQRKVLLYLHHHPFFDAFAVRADVGDKGFLSHLVGWNTRRFRRLKDAYSLMQCIRDRVDILLFGHQHFGLDYSTEGQRYGIPLALDGSSSTATQMDTDRMRYRVIDTDAGTVVTRFVALP
ncbi:metallophosphoesterase family protein [Rhodoferax lacus]|nr:metallophosphoesterase [Rhodoferax lacus]